MVNDDIFPAKIFVWNDSTECHIWVIFGNLFALLAAQPLSLSLPVTTGTPVKKCAAIIKNVSM